VSGQVHPREVDGQNKIENREGIYDQSSPAASERETDGGGERKECERGFLPSSNNGDVADAEKDDGGKECRRDTE
jgi:hypothetical protein